MFGSTTVLFTKQVYCVYLCVRKTFLLVQLSGCKILNFAQELRTEFFIVAYKLGHTFAICCFWSYKSLKNDQATKLFFFLETEAERKWCTNSKMHCGG